MRRSPAAAVVSLLAVVALVATACASDGDAPASAPATESTASSAGGSTWPGSGGTGTPTVTLPATEADIGFLQDMYAHHTQAVVLATVAAQHGQDGRVRSLAFDMAVGQADEQGQMRALLADRGAGLGAPDRTAMAWAGHPVDLAAMPGMIAQADLAAVQQLRGAELDERFVALMTTHHEGGVAMADHGIQAASDPAVVTLATRMRSTQQRELTDLALLAR